MPSRFGRLAGALAITVMLASACRRPPVPAGGAVVRISQRNEPSDLDPATASLPDEFFIIRALSEGLVLPAMPGEPGPLPAAARSWSVSADGLTWTFHLRPGAQWSNGEPVGAGDFLASYQRVLTPAMAAPRAELLYPVRNARAFAAGRLANFSLVGFQAPDPLTLVVVLERPVPLLEYAASGPWIPVNPRVVARWGKDWTRPEHQVGNGPYSLTEWSPHRRITVRRNPAYRDAATIGPAELQFLRFDDGDTEDRAYRAGEVDVTMTVPVDRIAGYERERPTELHRQLLAEERYLSFNTQRAPFDRAEVRRALALAIDRNALVADVLRGNGRALVRLATPEEIPVAITGAAMGAEGAADVTEARRLLAAGGFAGGRGFRPFELAAWGGNSGQRVIEAVQQMWANALGIHATMAVREARVHVAAVQAGSYDVALMPLIPWVRDPAATLGEFGTGAPNNYPHWSSAAFDHDLAAARSESDPVQRLTLLRAAADELATEMPAAPLYRNLHSWLMRPEIRGWRENAWWDRTYRRLRRTGGP